MRRKQLQQGEGEDNHEKEPVLNMIVELKIWRDCSRNDDD